MTEMIESQTPAPSKRNVTPEPQVEVAVIAGWHSHWVVLAEDAGCAGGLKVRDVSPGQDLLPATAPGLPLALNSPRHKPASQRQLGADHCASEEAANVAFNAVTDELQVHPEGHRPLLCVVLVRKVASRNLSFSGRVMLKH
jgi:hypothetical protein